MPRVKLGYVAREYKAVSKDSTNLPIVGLEHLTPSDITLDQWDEGVETTFTKAFKKGQMLFGRRRAYLKKAALAPFDGICSGDIIVIEAIPDKINPALLPFIIQNDLLFDFAVGNSAGSLSPRVKWESLKEYEFELPGIDEQERLVQLLESAHQAKKGYQKLIEATDDLVKSQFIEMIKPYEHATLKAGSFFTDMRNGVSPSTNGTYHEKVLTLSAVTQGMFDPEAWKDGNFDTIPPNEKRISDTDFYMCRGNGNRTLVGTGVYSHEARPDLVFPDTVIAAHVNQSIVSLPFLYVAWQMPAIRQQIESRARTTNGTYKINQSIIANIEVALPPMPVQQAFITVIEQADKSKFELKQAIERIDNLIKSLIQQG